MRANVYGIYLTIDGGIGKMNDEFKQADKITWKLGLEGTVLLIIVVAVIVVSIAK